MIHDPIVEVSCDECPTSVYVELEYKFFDYSGKAALHATPVKFWWLIKYAQPSPRRMEKPRRIRL